MENVVIKITVCLLIIYCGMGIWVTIHRRTLPGAIASGALFALSIYPMFYVFLNVVIIFIYLMVLVLVIGGTFLVLKLLYLI